MQQRKACQRWRLRQLGRDEVSCCTGMPRCTSVSASCTLLLQPSSDVGLSLSFTASNRSFLDMAADALRAKSVANDVSQLACCPC